jgi:hypothetical protein
VKGGPVYKSSNTQPKPTYITIIRSYEEPPSVCNKKQRNKVTDNNTQTLKVEEYYNPTTTDM